MKKYGLATLLATLMLASFLGCTNDRKSEKEALQDTSPIQNTRKHGRILRSARILFGPLSANQPMK